MAINNLLAGVDERDRFSRQHTMPSLTQTIAPTGHGGNVPQASGSMPQIAGNIPQPLSRGTQRNLSIANLLGQAAQAIQPEGIGARLGGVGQQITQERRFGNAMARTLAGQELDPSELQGLDANSVSNLQALQQQQQQIRIEAQKAEAEQTKSRLDAELQEAQIVEARRNLELEEGTTTTKEQIALSREELAQQKEMQQVGFDASHTADYRRHRYTMDQLGFQSAADYKQFQDRLTSEFKLLQQRHNFNLEMLGEDPERAAKLNRVMSHIEIIMRTPGLILDSEDFNSTFISLLEQYDLGDMISDKKSGAPWQEYETPASGSVESAAPGVQPRAKSESTPTARRSSVVNPPYPHDWERMKEFATYWSAGIIGRAEIDRQRAATKKAPKKAPAQPKKSGDY